MSFPRFEFLPRSLAYDAGITMTRISGGKKVLALSLSLSLSLGDKGEGRFADTPFLPSFSRQIELLLRTTSDDGGASLNTN